MIVQQLKIESHKVVTIEPTANLSELLQVLDNSGYQHIPVVSDGIFSGMVGYSEVHKAFFEAGSDKDSFLKETTVDSIAINREAIIDEEGDIEKIFKKIDRMPFLAVLDESNHFNGIITRSVLFGLLRDALGMHKPGVRLTVSMPEMKGYLEKFANVVKNYSNIFGLIVLDDDTNFGYRRVSFKVGNEADIDALTEDLRGIGVRVFHVTN
ncbi:MAG: CBS domain-containing protein [Tumebacillaceae bacterium]